MPVSAACVEIEAEMRTSPIRAAIQRENDEVRMIPPIVNCCLLVPLENLTATYQTILGKQMNLRRKHRIVIEANPGQNETIVIPCKTPTIFSDSLPPLTPIFFFPMACLKDYKDA